MLEALACLIAYLTAAALMATIAIGLVIAGTLRAAWLLFCWPARWFSR